MARQTYSGWGGSFQIHGFKDQVCCAGQLDDLSTHQTEFFVVIQYSVHVLNPDGINRAVKDQPLPVWGLLGTDGKWRNMNLSYRQKAKYVKNHSVFAGLLKKALNGLPALPDSVFCTVYRNVFR